MLERQVFKTRLGIRRLVGCWDSVIILNIFHSGESNDCQLPILVTSTYYLQSSNGSYVITPTTSSTNQLTTSTVVQLTGDTSLSTNLYNYFLISLDDFIQNHLNDGLVTITRSQTSIQIPDYAYSTTQTRQI
jgi:hypothetical protein